MKNINSIPIKIRLKELLIDYIAILAFLVGVLIISSGFYFFILGEIPKFGETGSQLISFLFSVFPIILIFSYLDYKNGTFGKQFAGLKIIYKNKTFAFSLLRNVIKFLPWQLAHFGIISGIYSDFNSFSSQFLTFLAIFLFFLYLLQGLFSKDKRYLADFIAKTQVVEK
ncbi:RDD family protein [Candidatus Gracilibacteria bacterium]|nr:MAG: RDD family protein [Candidatus Gracilibacteria bacterium]